MKICKTLFFLLLSVTFLGCTSNKEKALDTIKKEMFKTLYDFESYQPVETTLEELRHDQYGDTIIFDKVMLIQYLKEQLNAAQKKFNDAERTHNIWYSDYYMSSTSRRKCEEAEKEMDQAVAEMGLNIKIWRATNDSIKQIAKQCDGKPYGWRVTHKFRCKTKGGMPDLATYTYFMDKKCKKILRRLNEDDLSYDDYKTVVDSSLKEDNSETDAVEENI